MERPPAPPEAVLIRLAREAADIRIAEAAKRAGVSVARWSQIEAGSEIRHGNVNPVTGRAGTIARMAAEVGLTPERMASEGQRPDAAEILAEIIRQRGDDRPAVLEPVPPVSVAPRRPRRLKALEASDPEGLAPFLQAVLRQVYTAAGIISAFPPGGNLPGLDQLPELEPVLEQMPGETVFPGSATDATLWDHPLLSAAERVRLVAKVRYMAAGHNSGQRDRRVSGLTAWHGSGADGAVPLARYQAAIT